jgi:hypothetical protein
MHFKNSSHLKKNSVSISDFANGTRKKDSDCNNKTKQVNKKGRQKNQPND